MNLTHSNPEGAQTVAECGLCECTTELLDSMCRCPGSGAGREWLVAGLDVISIALGLLINLAEGVEDNKRRILAWDGGILELLVHIMELSAQKSTCGTSGDGSGGADEVTADDLEIDEAEGEASIVEVYAAMLLGFLVEGDPKLRQRAAALLPGGSLQPVVSAVERCLEFYIRADAITDSTSAKLKKLLASLKGTATSATSKP